MKRRVIVVDGPLAFGMRRFQAARANDVGLEVLTLPLLASRLAGGFRHRADRETLSMAVARALRDGGFAQLEAVRNLPGMVRAALQSLDRAWSADLDLDNLASTSARVSDLAMLQQRVSEVLPQGAMLPRQLRDAALERVSFAPKLFGSVELDKLVDVVEALRWTRELLSRGDASAGDIAITGAATPAWDEHILALARQAGIPVHFSHGLPALNSWEGQSCAALADVLGNGVNQERVRRLLMHSSSSAMGALPDDWAAGLPQQAGLFTVDQWRRALQSARGRRSDPDAAERTLIPMLELLATGIANAEQAGKSFLGGASLGLWKDALRNAPPAAIAMSLESLRVRDDRHPANSVVWCPASHLVAAPRRWMRLLGVAGRTWPRSESEDPLLPDQVLSRRRLIPVSITQRDRRCFDLLVTQPAEEIVVSRSRRSADGALQSASALWPATAPVRTCARTRIPEHAFSEADRLLARPAEAGRSGRIKAALTCWRNWDREEATPHDGAVRAGHPAVARAVSRLHSATSLMLMARHPLGFLWRYALDMNS